MTVQGPIAPEKLGVTLPHEHVLVDFIGADKVSRDRYQADEVFKVALPHLKRIREVGSQTLVECTPAYLGRDPKEMRISDCAATVAVAKSANTCEPAASRYVYRMWRKQCRVHR